MSNIKFGTDGWRALIGKDFNEENVAKVIQAFCDFQSGAKNRLVYVGYDRREKSETSAKLVCEVLAANGFHVCLSENFCPTPCISWHVKTKNALAGIVVTASHNPSGWNGIKFKESYGGAASPEFTSQIEKHLQINEKSKKQPVKNNFARLKSEKKIEYFHPDETYVVHLRNFIDCEAIRSAGFKIVVDPLFGAGTNYIQNVLNTNLFQIHDKADPKFGGLNPEPIEKNLSDLKASVLKNSADIGLATDGDADRIGAYDEKGHYVSSHQIFALLLRHNVLHRKLRGPIVKSVSTTELINKMCAKYNLPLIETPIGFKYICKELLKHNALMGGEESGGISLREHVHERDGVLNGLLLLEMMAIQKKSLSKIIQDMDDEFGKFYFRRDDYHLTDQKMKEVKERVSNTAVQEVGGIPVVRTDDRDGVKYYFKDSSWLLIRTSGTEPLLRTYVEAASQRRVEELMQFSKNYFELEAE